MPEPDVFDPNHALDGWRPPAPAAAPDLALEALPRAAGKKSQPLLLDAEPGGFDPLHLLDGWRPPVPAPLDLELKSLLRAGSGPDEATLARLKARGYEMLDVEDIELAEAPPPRVVLEDPVQHVPPEPAQAGFLDDIQLPPAPPPPAESEAPVLDFRVAPPPPESDPQQVIADIALPKVEAPPAVVDMPAVDISAIAPRPRQPDPRLLAHWQAQAWTALARQIAGASAELSQAPEGPHVESHAPQWLCAIWPPQAADTPLDRWPDMAALVAAETRAEALQQLLAELPQEASLWSADLEGDWELIAELVLHQDGGLRPAQAGALRELAEVERRSRLARMGEGYAQQGRVARRRA